MVYDFIFLGGENNEFVFETTFSVGYIVRFKKSDYLFHNNDFELSENVFEFVLDVIHNPTNTKLPADPNIGITVAEIFKDFFDRNQNRIIIYICESADNKQFQRMKKFDIWFKRYQDSSFLKIDETLTDRKNNKFPISLVLKNNHPQLHIIIDAFIGLTRLGEK